MEVKGILEKIRRQEKGKEEYFFALEIGLEVVKSAIWLVEGSQVKVVAVGESQSWDGKEELLNVVDASLSSLAKGFSPEGEAAEPDKIIFGLPSDWVEEEKIIPDKLGILREISQKLELEPVGFVVTPEAISHFLKATEGVPPTAILISVAKDKLALALVRLGKAEPTQLVKRSQDLGDDVIEGLSRYGEEDSFPARILLYDGESELEEANQSLIDYPWQEEGARARGVAFLHLPKVEVLASDFDIKAVALAGGKEVARVAGIAADFIKKEEESPLPQKKAEEKVSGSLSAADFGFVRGKDIVEERKEEERETTPERMKPETALPSVKESPFVPQIPKPFLAKLNFSWLKRIDFSRLSSFLTNLVPKLKTGKKTPLVLGLVFGFLLLLLGGLFAFYWYFPKASILLLVEPEVLEEEFEIKVDPSLEAISKEELILPAEAVEVVVEGEKIIGTTGTKLVGEAATGEVTVYNGTSKEKLFTAGTVIISPSGIEFTLGEEVQIASQSGTAAEPIPGKTDVGVAAVEIGTEGNLAAGTEFTVDKYSQSDFVAKNESAFSGGTSREVQVVAEADQERLLSELETELESQALDQLRARISLEKRLLEESIKEAGIKKEFDQAVDEEAVEVGLRLEKKLIALSYSESEMRDLVNGVIEDKIPENFEFREEESEIDFSLKEGTKEEVVFTVKLTANLIPKLDSERIKIDLRSKYPLFAQAYLENLANVVGVEIKITPRLPARFLTLPRIAKNIDIKVQIK